LIEGTMLVGLHTTWSAPKPKILATLLVLSVVLFYLFIYFIQFVNQQWHRSTSKEHTGRMANTGLTNHVCAANK